MSFIVAVTDYVFPSLEPEQLVLASLGVELRPAQCKSEEEIIALTQEADAVLNCYAKMTAPVIEGMKRCRIIARYGIGVDNVDLAAATRAGIVVTNVPDYCIDEVSDHAMALLLALARKVSLANRHAHAGRWEMPAVAPIHRLRGSILGLLGFGRISQLLTPKAKAFGLSVISCDPLVEQQTMLRAGVEKVDFAELIRISDFISIHAPLVPET